MGSCLRPSAWLYLGIVVVPISGHLELNEGVGLQGGDTLDLGKGHVLEFVMAPNLHWPDTMFTLDRGTGIIFTCDAFGMHYCTETVQI